MHDEPALAGIQFLSFAWRKTEFFDVTLLRLRDYRVIRVGCLFLAGDVEFYGRAKRVLCFVVADPQG